MYRRENSFAQSVTNGDMKAFAEHLHPDAVFLDGSVPRRGRAAVVEGWTPIIAGNDAALRWKANEVVISADAQIAYSRGPYSVEQRAADAKPRFQVGTFSSVWVKGTDGVWRVLYDGAVGARNVDTREELDRFMARATPKCVDR